MSKTKLAAGALIGAVAGVVAGVLTAPKSGKETRDDLKAKADELKNGADKTVKDVREKAEKAVNDVREKVTGTDDAKK